MEHTAVSSVSETLRPNRLRLPVNITNFRDLRSEGLIYVDKSDLVVDVVENYSYVFLARPRRFGKSLLTSTFAEFFRSGNDALIGLKAEGRWPDRTYPVVELDFSDFAAFENPDEFHQKFRKHIKDRLDAAGIPIPDMPEATGPELWRAALSKLQDRVVVLIDEYDAPLSLHLHEKKLFSCAHTAIADFFFKTKPLGSKLRFLFVTGIMRFRNAELFSGFNIINDISFNPRYGAIVGYTEAEVKKNFGEYIAYAAQELECTMDDLLHRMRRMYDGYCFDSKMSCHLYSPWSVLQFFSRPYDGLEDYWLESGGTSSMLNNYLKLHGGLTPHDLQYFDKTVETTFSQLKSPNSLQSLELPFLLMHTGYLTIKAITENVVSLGLPNEEVRRAFAAIYSSSLWKTTVENGLTMQNFKNSIIECNPARIESSLNNIFKTLDAKTFPLDDEATVQALVQVFCLGGDVESRVEVHSYKGRSDLEFSIGGVDVVIEFKYAASSRQVKGRMREALEQIVARDYGQRREGRTLLRLGAVYAEDERRFTIGGPV